MSLDFSPSTTEPDSLAPIATAPETNLQLLLAPSLGAAMGRAHRVWRDAINDIAQQLNISESRWQVMVTLVKVGEGTSQQQVATALRIEMPSLTRTLNKLEKQGLVERRQSSTDKRSHELWLTEEGRQITQHLQNRIDAIFDTVMAGVSEAELKVFARVVDNIEQNARLLRHPDNRHNQDLELE